jgi:putative ATP-dependent endonuclease of OLD family
MSILIDTVRISNFRLFRNVEISLSRFTLLVGMNNAGKTSLLRALQIVFNGTRSMTEDDFAIGTEGKKIVIDMRIIPVDDESKRVKQFNEQWLDNFGKAISQEADDKDFVAFRTEITLNQITNTIEIERSVLSQWQEWNDTDAWSKSAVNESRLQLKPFHFHFKEAQRDIQEDLRSRTSDVGRLLANLKFDETKQGELEKQIKELNESAVGSSEDLSRLRNHLGQLQVTIGNSAATIEITPFTKNLRDLAKGVNIHLQDNDTNSLPLEYHGMGTRSWASLLAFGAYISRQSEKAVEESELHYPILALEEPEAHLHPNAQRTLYQQLRQMTGQQIVSTHSPFIAAQCGFEEIRYFSKTSDGGSIRALDVKSLSDEEKRKIRREVMNTRGELLFARAIVLAEGETEEQALPIFAEKYWGKYSFELGVNFIGVGGEGNYAPFLRIAQTLGIPWFIFSDGEENARNNITNALSICGIAAGLSHPNIIVLDNGQSFEKYLWEQGYQDEIKQAIIKRQEPDFKSPQHREAKTKEIIGWSEGEILTEMKNFKTKLAPLYAEIISKLPDEESKFPPAIRVLLEQVSATLLLKQKEESHV